MPMMRSTSSDTFCMRANISTSVSVSFGLDSTAVDTIRATVPGAIVERYAGTDRYDTAATVAANVWPQGSTEAFYATKGQ